MFNKVITSSHCWYELEGTTTNSAKFTDSEVVISAKATIARVKLPAFRQRVLPAFAEHLENGYLIAPVIRAEAVRYLAGTVSAASIATL